MRATIKLKLASAFGFIILMLLATAAYGIFSLSNLNTALEDVITGPAERLKLAQMLNVTQLQQIRQQKNLLMGTSLSEMQGYISSSDDARRHFDETFKSVLALATEQGKANWAKLEGFTTEFRKQDDRIRALMLAGNTAGAQQVSTNEARTVTNEIDALLTEVVNLEETRLAQADDQADLDYVQTRTIMISVAGLALVIAVLAAIWIAFSRPDSSPWSWLKLALALRSG